MDPLIISAIITAFAAAITTYITVRSKLRVEIDLLNKDELIAFVNAKKNTAMKDLRKIESKPKLREPKVVLVPPKPVQKGSNFMDEEYMIKLATELKLRATAEDEIKFVYRSK